MAQQKYIAISPEKQIYHFTELGLEGIKEIHSRQGVSGWQYGLLSEKARLLANVKNVTDFQSENEALKQKIAALENKAQAAINTVEETKRKK